MLQHDMAKGLIRWIHTDAPTIEVGGKKYIEAGLLEDEINAWEDLYREIGILLGEE